MKKIIFLVFFTTTLFFFFLCSANVVLAKILFEDDFADGNADGWDVVQGHWWVEDENYKTRVSSPFSLSETQVGDYLWKDYVFEVDIFIQKGFDRNIFFRVNDGRSIYGDGIHEWNWPISYGIHITSLKIYLIKFLPDKTNYLKSVDFDFPVGTKRKLRVVLSGRDIKIFFDDNLLIEHSDTSENPYLYGRIALAASTGTIYPSEVWFDNVVVTSLGNTPVVLLPGIGAGWNRGLIDGGEAEDWGMNPLAYYFVYRKLINSFLESGFTEGEDFFIYNYDWRKPFNQIAEDFNEYLQSIEAPQVDVVGHSMGGMVGRTYLQNYPGHKIDKLVTVGSPHHGGLQAYPIWEAGEFWETKSHLKALMEIPILVYQITHQEGNRVKAVRALFPSIQDFLPTFDFLQDKRTEQMKDVTLHRQRNLTLIELNEFLTEDNKSFLRTIYGNNFRTLEKIIVQSIAPYAIPWYDQTADRWEDGKPACVTHRDFTNECPEAMVYTNAGEGTVLVRSATIEGVDDYELTLKHTDLVREEAGIEKIFEVLGVEGQVADDLLSEITDVAFFLILSPAQILVTDPNDQQIGFGIAPADSIEGGFYDEEAKLVMLANPLPGNYNLRVLGEAAGFYRLLTGRFSDEETVTDEYFGKTKEGQEDNFQFSFENGGRLLVDPQGLLDLKSAERRLIYLRPFLNHSSKNLVDCLLRTIGRTKQLIERGQFNLAGIYLKGIIKQIYLLRRMVAFNYKGELEKTSLDCQGAYFNLSELNNLKTSRKIAEVNLQTARRQLENLNKYLENKENSKEAALIFLLAQEYLQKAQGAFEEDEYEQTLLYSSIVKYLTSEIMVIR